MKTEIKQLIEQIKNGEVPQGYKKTKIGIVPIEWKVKKLINICKTVGGGTPNTKNKHYWSGQIPWVSSSDIAENNIFDINIHRFITEQALNNSATKIVPKNSILLVSRVGVGKLAISSCDICTSQDFTNLTEIKGNIYTIAYLVKVSIDLKLKMLQGTSIKGITSSEIKNLDVIYPSILEQKKISEILSTQDKVIELKEKLIEEKQKQKKYLMQNLLTGKIRLKSFTGEWKKYVMGNLGNTYSGLSGKNKDDFGKGKPYIPYTNIFLNPIIDVNELGYVDVLENEKQSKVCYGDIFFTTSSETPEEVGMSSVLLENVDELYLNSFCFGFRLNNFSVLSPIYASHYFRGDTFRNILNRLAQGATRFNLSKNNLLKSILLLPPLEEQKAIAEILSTQDKEIKLLQKELEEEKQKKKALMQLLLTGIVRV
ncbi:restriction endonuclease subunit S [Thomasclavelia spiroformis]|uniref:restriction endonuclease subunit S n=1 Tax=Thomasclavelia spiroformis TaxID=29348 RepID=UPI00399A584C